MRIRERMRPSKWSQSSCQRSDCAAELESRFRAAKASRDGGAAQRNFSSSALHWRQSSAWCSAPREIISASFRPIASVLACKLSARFDTRASRCSRSWRRFSADCSSSFIKGIPGQARLLGLGSPNHARSSSTCCGASEIEDSSSFLGLLRGLAKRLRRGAESNSGRRSSAWLNRAAATEVVKTRSIFYP